MSLVKLDMLEDIPTPLTVPAVKAPDTSAAPFISIVVPVMYDDSSEH